MILPHITYRFDRHKVDKNTVNLRGIYTSEIKVVCETSGYPLTEGNSEFR